MFKLNPCVYEKYNCLWRAGLDRVRVSIKRFVARKRSYYVKIVVKSRSSFAHREILSIILKYTDLVGYLKKKKKRVASYFANIVICDLFLLPFKLAFDVELHLRFLSEM